MLTIEDYRRTLLWAGWKLHQQGNWYRGKDWLHDSDLQMQSNAPLLLLDYSVLEKVRGMVVGSGDNESGIYRFQKAYAAIIRERSGEIGYTSFEAIACIVRLHAVGDYTRAAIAAGLVEKEEKRDGHE